MWEEEKRPQHENMASPYKTVGNTVSNSIPVGMAFSWDEEITENTCDAKGCQLDPT